MIIKTEFTQKHSYLDQFLNRKITYSMIAQASLLIFVSGVLFSYIKAASYTNFSLFPTGKDPISMYEKRFKKIRKELPTNGLIGYAWEKKPNPNDPSSPFLFDYYLSQYSLSPLIIINTENLPILVGNFKEKPDDQKTSKFYIKNFGQNIYLFVKR